MGVSGLALTIVSRGPMDSFYIFVPKRSTSKLKTGPSISDLDEESQTTERLCFLVAHELVRMYFGCALESRVPSHLDYPPLLRQLGVEHDQGT